MNGYLKHVIEKTIACKLKNLTSPTSHTVKKCPVYLYRPWLGIPLVGLENKIKASVEKGFFAVKQSIIFTFRPFLPEIKEHVLPASLLSNVVYNFSFPCNSWYVGGTSERLQDRIL